MRAVSKAQSSKLDSTESDAHARRQAASVSIIFTRRWYQPS